MPEAARRQALSSTRRRRQILDALAVHPAFVSAQALHAQLQRQADRPGLTTVYRTLRAFAAAGTVDSTRGGDGTVLYRLHDESGHHHYLRCRSCGFGVPVRSEAVETWTGAVGREHDFRDVTHIVELEGLCGRCRDPVPG